MSLHVLTVPSRDVAAEALGLLLDAPAPTPLAQLEIPTPGQGCLLRLGVLGASHVVTASRAGAELVEQISCDALGAGGERLPAHRQVAGYQLRTSVTPALPSDLDEFANQLRAASRASDAWVCGEFPGSTSALTALTGGPVPGGWEWRTWHLYPGQRAGAVVRTETRWVP